MVYGRDGDAWVVVASGGAAKHPGWYFNLLADPDVRIKVGAHEHPVRARTAEGDERRRLWEYMVGVYPPYTGYQESTERVIAVVVLEPR